MVIVIEGNKESSDIVFDEKDLVEMVNKYIKDGLTKKDAIKKVSEATNVNKNKIYNLFK